MKKVLIGLGTVVVAGVAIFSTINQIDKTSEEPKEEVVVENENINSTKGNAGPAEETKQLEIYTEDTSVEDDNIIQFKIEKKQGQLMVNEIASLYLLEGYSLKEEDKTGEIIFSKNGNDKAFARIKKTGKVFKTEEYRQSLQKMIGATTMMVENNPNDLPNTALQKAKLYAVVSNANSQPISNTIHIINEFSGELYQVEIITESTKEENKLVSEFLSMVSTIH